MKMTPEAMQFLINRFKGRAIQLREHHSALPDWNPLPTGDTIESVFTSSHDAFVSAFCLHCEPSPDDFLLWIQTDDGDQTSLGETLFWERRKNNLLVARVELQQATFLSKGRTLRVGVTNLGDERRCRVSIESTIVETRLIQRLQGEASQ